MELFAAEPNVVVTAAPDILNLKDTDGDGKSDIRKVLFTGFALVNPESRITSLRFGVDNWIHAANNGQRGDITFPRRDIFQTATDGPASVSVLGADFRFRLDRGLFEAESGPQRRASPNPMPEREPLQRVHHARPHPHPLMTVEQQCP